MAKKQKDIQAQEPKKDVNPYELKTDAVDRLVNAEKKEYPRLTPLNDPGKAYRSGFLDISIGNLVPKHQRGEPQSRHRIYSPTAVRQRDDRPLYHHRNQRRHSIR